MTKSTGWREQKRKREALFSAELILHRAMAHALSAAGWARRMKDADEHRNQGDAFQILHLCYLQVLKEQAELS